MTNVTITNITAAPVILRFERHTPISQYFTFQNATGALINILNANFVMIIRDAFSKVVATYSVGDGITIYNETTCLLRKDVYEKDIPAGNYTYSFMVNATGVEYPFAGPYISLDINNSNYVNSNSYHGCCTGN